MTTTVRFGAGQHFAYQFDANGNVTDHMTYILGRASSAPSDQAGPILNRPGNWLHMSAGVFSGFWIHEATDSAWPEPQIADVVFTPPPPPPVTGIPPIPAGSYVFKKDFSDGTLAPFRVLTIPSDPNHVANDPMAKYNRYGSKNISVANGVLRQAATRRTDGLYDASFVGTCDDGHGGAATFSFQYGQVDFAFRANTGYVCWTTPLWLIGWVGGAWESSEIDGFEQIEGKMTGNIHGPANTQFASVAPPGDLATAWHMGRIVKTASYVALSLDGKEVGRWNGAMPHKQAIVSDVKVGVPWKNLGPNATTPDELWLELAWITVQ